MKKFLSFCALFFCFIGSLSAELKVLIFIGSTRLESYNKKLAKEAAEMAKQMGASVTLCDLKEFPMPFYDGDLEAEEGIPENAKRLRSLMKEHDAIIIVSPEYNRSIPGVLKNALDWLSRGEKGGSDYSAFEGKHFAIMSASTGKRGGAAGLIHLRTILEDVGAIVLKEEVTIPRAQNYFSQEDRQINLQLKSVLENLLQNQDALKSD